LYHSCRSCMRKEAVCFYCPHQQLKSPSIFDETYKFSGKNISFLGCRRPKQKVLLIVLKINWLVSLQKNFQCSGILAGNSFSFKRGSLRATETTSQPPIWKKNTALTNLFQNWTEEAKLIYTVEPQLSGLVRTRQNSLDYWGSR